MFAANERGQGTVEMVIVVVLIALVGMAVYRRFGQEVSGRYDCSARRIDDMTGASPCGSLVAGSVSGDPDLPDLPAPTPRPNEPPRIIRKDCSFTDDRGVECDIEVIDEHFVACTKDYGGATLPPECNDPAEIPVEGSDSCIGQAVRRRCPRRPLGSRTSTSVLAPGIVGSRFPFAAATGKVCA